MELSAVSVQLKDSHFTMNLFHIAVGSGFIPDRKIYQIKQHHKTSGV